MVRQSFVLIWAVLAISPSAAAFDDTGWTILYQENFDSSYTAANGQTFGTDNWLYYQLLNDGQIVVTNGYAQLNAPDFWNAALIRSTQTLPSEYKIRTKIGYINYDLTNYEQADYDDPDFNDHAAHYENGMYFLTITNDTCIGNQCAEDWWHQHRKMVIDVDNHINWSGGGETFHPIYMVYMDPVSGAGGNILRTWDGVAWDTSLSNWNVAHTYEYETWYYAELEKKDGFITLALYDAAQNIIQAPPPVSFDKVFAINEPLEFLYVGEPHTDDYEGDVRIDEITLLLPEISCCVGIRGNIDNSFDNLVDISDIVYLVSFMFDQPNGPVPICIEEADMDGSGGQLPVDISDLVYLVRYMFQSGPQPLNCP